MATITEIQGTDTIQASRSTINTNFTNLNNDKSEKDNVLELDNTDAFTPDADYEPATKKYVDDLVGTGGVDADISTKGVLEVATSAEINAGTVAGGGDTTADLAVTPSKLLASNYGLYLPSSDEKDALDGTGTPSSTNKYVTNDDTAATPAASKVARFKADGLLDDAGLALTTAGDIPYSDGTDLQRLGIGTALQVLRTNAGATAPEWVSMSTDKLVGAGDSGVKTYWNYTIPFVTGGTDLPWETAPGATMEYNGFWVEATSAAKVVTQEPIFPIMMFDSGKDVFVEWTASLSDTSHSLEMGLQNPGTLGTDWESNNNQKVQFTVNGSDGKLYAHTDNGYGGTGVGHTEVEITGITLTDNNTYRIEWESGVEARFYINGVLETTITSNIPDGGDQNNRWITFGGNLASGATLTMTEPNFSVEK